MLRFIFTVDDGSASVETGRGVWLHVFRRLGRYRICVRVVTPDGREDEDCGQLNVAPRRDGGLPEMGVDAGVDLPVDAGADLAPDLPPPDLHIPDVAPDMPPDLPAPDLTPDLPTPDIAPDLPAPDVTPDLPPPDIAPDLEPDLAPDLAPDLPPDLTPDLPPDLAPDVAPDLPPDLAPDLPPDLAPDVAPDSSPDTWTPCFGNEVGGTGANGYTLKIVPACHVDISKTGTPLQLLGDDQGLLTFMPFNFSYFDLTQFAVGVSSNGYLQFPGGSTLELTKSQPAAIPTSVAPNNLVAVFWDNLSPVANVSDVYAQTFGAAPDRVHVIQWDRWSIKTDVIADPITLTFAVYLYETSNVIEMQYLTLLGGVRATGEKAAVGIEDSTGTQGVQYSFQQPGGVSTASGIRFVPQ